MKKFMLLLLCIAATATMTMTVNARPARTNQATAAAIRLYKAGNYTQSYLRFSEIVKRDPSNALAYYYLGMSSVRLGKRDEAINSYTRAAALSPHGVLGSYAKQGIRCTEDPVNCHKPVSQPKTEESEEDRFIQSKFGSGLSNKARGVYEQQKIENVKREMNRDVEITPQNFKEYKDFSSEGPSDSEISEAIRTLDKAGLNDILEADKYSDIPYLLGNQNYTNNSDILNMLYGNSNSTQINPQLIQALITAQSMTDF